MSDSKQIVTTLENGLPVDPEKSLLPINIVGDRAIVEYIEPGKFLSEKAKIERPVDYKDPYAKGRIVSLGGGEYGTTIPPSLKTGQTVNYWHQSAIDFIIDENGEKKKYHLIRISDIFMIL